MLQCGEYSGLRVTYHSYRMIYPQELRYVDIAHELRPMQLGGPNNCAEVALNLPNLLALPQQANSERYLLEIFLRSFCLHHRAGTQAKDSGKLDSFISNSGHVEIRHNPMSWMLQCAVMCFIENKKSQSRDLDESMRKCIEKHLMRRQHDSNIQQHGVPHGLFCPMVDVVFAAEQLDAVAR
jgi:hypothetical protein